MFEKLSRFYYNKGLQLAREGQISAAVQNLAKAVSYDRNNIQTWNLAGLCHYRLGRYKTAEYCWRRSLEQRREENTAGEYLADLSNALAETAPYFSRVASLCGDKKYKEAAGVLSKEICSRFGLSAALLNYLGVLHALDAQINAAAKCWTTVLALDKSNADAKRYLEAVEKRPLYRLGCKLFSWKEKLRESIRKKPDKKE